jgi:hypothetical protein
MVPIVAALIKAGFSIFGGAIASKGEEFIKDKLGIDVGEMLGSEEGRLKLRQLEMQHQEFLVTAAQASEVREVQYFQEEVKDRASARESNAAIATSVTAPWHQKALMPGMALLVTLGFFFCLGALFYLSAKNIHLDDNSRDILIYAFGIISAGWMAIMNFLFGSSHGSQAKDATIAGLAKGTP